MPRKDPYPPRQYPVMEEDDRNDTDILPPYKLMEEGNVGLTCMLTHPPIFVTQPEETLLAQQAQSSSSMSSILPGPQPCDSNTSKAWRSNFYQGTFAFRDGKIFGKKK